MSISTLAIAIALAAILGLGAAARIYQLKYEAEAVVTQGLKVDLDRVKGQLTEAAAQAKREHAANVKNTAEREALRRQTEAALHEYELSRRSDCDLTVLPDASVRLLDKDRVPAAGANQPPSNLGTP